MRAKADGRVKDVWKEKEHGWCLRQSVDAHRKFRTIVYIDLPRKPRHKVGVPIKRGTKI